MHALRGFGWTTWVCLALDAAALAAAVRHAICAERSTFRWAIALIVVAFCAGLVLVAVVPLISFSGIEDVGPSMKATMLARGISEAMNTTAFALMIVPLWAGPFAVGEVRRARHREAARRNAATRRDADVR